MAGSPVEVVLSLDQLEEAFLQVGTQGFTGEIFRDKPREVYAIFPNQIHPMRVTGDIRIDQSYTALIFTDSEFLIHF